MWHQPATSNLLYQACILSEHSVLPHCCLLDWHPKSNCLRQISVLSKIVVVGLQEDNEVSTQTPRSGGGKRKDGKKI